MKLLKRLREDRKFLLVAIVVLIGVFVIPYIAIPALIIWWFYKKSKFSKKAKVITTSTIGGLFAIFIIWFGIAYATDAQPSIAVTEPKELTSIIKAPQITIAGTYSPSDRTVEVNGQDIHASNGKFTTVYHLKQGQNKIEVMAGNLKWAYAYLTVTRELTDAEKAALITPTATPKPTTEIKNTTTPTAKPSSVAKPTPTSTPKPTGQQTAYNSNAIAKALESKIKQTFPTDSSGTVDIEPAVAIDMSGLVPNKVTAILDITLNGSYWDTKSTRTASYEYTTDIIKKVFPMDSSIYSIQITYNVPATDAYGKTSNTELDDFTISRDTYNKINFDNFIFTNMPKVADVYNENDNLQ